MDLNFDGYADFGIFGWITTGANLPYYYWIWNTEKQYFEYAFCLCNLEIDNNIKQLICKNRDSANSYTTDYYKFDEQGKLYKTKSITEETD